MSQSGAHIDFDMSAQVGLEGQNYYVGSIFGRLISRPLLHLCGSLCDDAAGDPVSGIARRIGYIVIGARVDHDGASIGIRDGCLPTS